MFEILLITKTRPKPRTTNVWITTDKKWKSKLAAMTAVREKKLDKTQLFFVYIYTQSYYIYTQILNERMKKKTKPRTRYISVHCKFSAVAFIDSHFLLKSLDWRGYSFALNWNCLTFQKSWMKTFDAILERIGSCYEFVCRFTKQMFGLFISLMKTESQHTNNGSFYYRNKKQKQKQFHFTHEIIWWVLLIVEDIF